MNKCEEHNWLYEEFDEACPLCDAVNAYKNRITRLLVNYIHLTSGRVFDAAGILSKVLKDVEDGKLD